MPPYDSQTISKITWNGALVSVQPRIRLGRSFDQRILISVRVRGSIGGQVSIRLSHPELANCKIYRGVERQEVNQTGNLQYRDALPGKIRQRQPLPGIATADE